MERRKRVLVVDDERPNRELLEALLAGLGHDSDLASDGAEALAKLDASHDLVLLDVMMSGLDGYEVARRIRKHPLGSDIPICMVTALSGREERLLAVEAGANDFISKPIDKTELRIRAASLLKTKEAQDAVKDFQAKLEAQNGLLRENVEQLRALGELKDEFVKIASHDLKNPLTCILGFAYLIDRSITVGTAMTEEMHALLPLIVKDARIMQKIITDFLDFQAIEDGQIKLDIEPVDLNAMAALSVGQNSSYAEGKALQLKLELAPGLPQVPADAARLRQVVDNLIGNAIKFSGEAGVITVRTRVAGAQVHFEVEDCGPGLSADDLQKLFVKYAKLGNRPTGGEKSSGLGLAICKKLIELNCGEIGGRNNAGGGATFWFKLPIVQ